MSQQLDFSVKKLGETAIESPIALSTVMDDFIANYVTEDQRIIYEIETRVGDAMSAPTLIERAGPRDKIFFDPSKVSAGIVTCGGLCPGLNDVIRSIVLCLWHHYGVHSIVGLPNGYQGFLPENRLEPRHLTPESVSGIHRTGGTILGSSRGGGDRCGDIVDAIKQMNLNMLFAIGGDGTQKGALAIAEEALRRRMTLSVVGVPKTIDNDLSFVQRSFGFETAVARAVEAVSAAHVEATGAINGIGLVKVMGRESGFIAAHTALAMNDVNVVLVPEVPFDLDGDAGLLAHLERRLEQRGHAVVLVAEGAGQHHLEAEGDTDASGNTKLGDIGVYLKARISAYAKQRGIPHTVKYIDPSYMIRSAPANPNDSIYCARLGTHAVHAAMAGKTAVLIGLMHNHYVHIPTRLSVTRRNCIDPESSLWRDVVIATGQPALMLNNPPA